MKIAQTSTAPRPAHSVADRPGFGPTPRSRRTYAARPEGRAMRTLRATAYVLASLASLVFLVLVAYGTLRFAELQQLFPAQP